MKWSELISVTVALIILTFLSYNAGYKDGVKSQLLSAEEVKEWQKQYARDIVSTCVAIEEARKELK